MKYYVDITLLPSDDIGIHFLWSKVMMQVHLALVEIQDEKGKVPVATSFPEYRGNADGKCGVLGKKLRLLSEKKNHLEKLCLAKWFNRLMDYVHIKAIADVPKVTSYESFARQNFSGSVEKHIRRRVKRHKETPEQAALHFVNYSSTKGNKHLPFIRMRSLTSNEDFCLSIVRASKEFIQIDMQTFNSYGLSASGILPKF